MAYGPLSPVKPIDYAAAPAALAAATAPPVQQATQTGGPPAQAPAPAPAAPVAPAGPPPGFGSPPPPFADAFRSALETYVMQRMSGQPGDLAAVMAAHPAQAMRPGGPVAMPGQPPAAIPGAPPLPPPTPPVANVAGGASLGQRTYGAPTPPVASPNGVPPNAVGGSALPPGYTPRPAMPGMAPPAAPVMNPQLAAMAQRGRVFQRPTDLTGRR